VEGHREELKRKGEKGRKSTEERERKDSKGPDRYQKKRTRESEKEREGEWSYLSMGCA